MPHTARRRSPVAVALGAAFALIVALVPVTAAHAAGPGSVTVTLTDDGAPAVAASVSVTGPDFGFTSTDSSGVATLTDLALGDYTLAASSSDGRQLTATLSLTVTEPAWTGVLQFEPWPTGTSVISGSTVDAATGTPIPGATVTAFFTGAPSQWSSTSDAGGEFVVEALPAGDYVVEATAPGYFNGVVTTTVAEASTATVDFTLTAADARIEGRVIDGTGVGLAGIGVQANSAYGSLFTTSEADGSFTFEAAGGGEWELSTSSDTDWERSAVTVPVAAGSTTVAPDLVLVPRFTGTVTGLVASSDGVPEAQIGGFFDICVTVLTPAGDAVPGASQVTGGDSFYGFFLAPGDYTLYFEDCDPARAPHRYQPVYLGGSATLSGATIVTVETLVDTWLDTTTLFPELDTEPTHEAQPVRARDLAPAQRNLIQAPDMLRRGESSVIEVGAEHAGAWVSIWLHSRPTQLGGWQQVATDGTVAIEVPRNHPLGLHELVVQDASDAVMGWTDVRIRARITCLLPWLPACS